MRWWNHQTFIFHAVAADLPVFWRRSAASSILWPGDFMEPHIRHANSCCPSFHDSPPKLHFWIQRPSGLGCCDTTRVLGGDGPPATASAWQPSGGALRTLLGCRYQPLFKNRQRWNAKCLLHTVQGHTLLTSTVTEMTTTRTCWCFGSRIPLRLDAHPSPPNPQPLPHLTSGTRAGCLAAEIPPAIGWAGVDAIQLNA